jgi:hypothetical protein
MKPLPGARLTLINPDPTAPYTGMLPGHVAGHYPRDALEIDLVRLARFAGARLILGAASAIDRAARTITVGSRRIAYDLASIDIGITSDLPDLEGFSANTAPRRNRSAPTPPAGPPTSTEQAPPPSPSSAPAWAASSSPWPWPTPCEAETAPPQSPSSTAPRRSPAPPPPLPAACAPTSGNSASSSSKTFGSPRSPPPPFASRTAARSPPPSPSAPPAHAPSLARHNRPRPARRLRHRRPHPPVLRPRDLRLRRRCPPRPCPAPEGRRLRGPRGARPLRQPPRGAHRIAPQGLRSAGRLPQARLPRPPVRGGRAGRPHGRRRLGLAPQGPHRPPLHGPPRGPARDARPEAPGRGRPRPPHGDGRPAALRRLRFEGRPRPSPARSRPCPPTRKDVLTRPGDDAAILRMGRTTQVSPPTTSAPSRSTPGRHGPHCRDPRARRHLGHGRHPAGGARPDHPPPLSPPSGEDARRTP